jgi:uncharacterized protein (DUF1778 family)
MLITVDQKPPNRKPKQFRLPTKVIGLLDRVAKVQQRSQTDVVVDATVAYAEEALLNRSEMVWDAAAYDAFEAVLSGPARPSAYVVESRKRKRAWE